MQSGRMRPGVRVRISEWHQKSKYDGMLGTVQQSFGNPEYLAFDVLLDDGRLELFWYHQLEEVD